jgi:hypothetical protein
MRTSKIICKQFNPKRFSFVTPYRVNLNENRLYNERTGHYSQAESSLAQIQKIRQQAETGLKVSLVDKHEREQIQIEE